MWKLGKIFDIDVSLHWSLLLWIGFIGMSAPAGGAFGAMTLVSVLFGCVLLHELGHSLAARQFDIDTSSIVLLPIGGVASLERMPREPLQELWIAVAGPLVNVVIALAIIVGLGPTVAFSEGLTGLQAWFQLLMIMNIGLVVFNMIPAFPMDGGRVFRSLSAIFMPYMRATQLAVNVGRVVAVLLGLVGLYFGHITLMLVAGFVFFAGAAEYRMVQQESRLRPEWQKGFARTFENARVFTANRAGEALQVIWDERERRYRYARAT